MSVPPPPPYVMLADQGSLRPPPYRRNVPRYDPNYQKKKSGGCCRCLCWCCCCLFLWILLVASILLYVYFAYNPKVPSYQVQGLDVKAFSVQPDFSLKTVLLVTVKAENSNRYIGFKYGKDSSVVATYKDSTLCSGVLPNFYQGPVNTTVMKIELEGQSEFGSGLQQALQDSKRQGRIPLLVLVKAPVEIVLGISSSRLVVHVNCSLVVDNLAPNKKIGIISSAYTFSVSL